MSGYNPRLNPQVLCVPFPAIAAGTAKNEIFYVTSLGGQLLSARVLNGGTISANDTDYTTLSVKQGSTVAATGDSSNTGASKITVTADTGVALIASTTVANRQWPRGTSTSLSCDKAETGAGKATTATCYFTLEFMQAAFDNNT